MRREDIKNFIRTLNECGCEEEDHSVYGNTMYKPSYQTDLASMMYQKGPSTAPMCPASYEKCIEQFCTDPHSTLEKLRPMMKEIGIGCPQSFAQALADMFEVAMEVGIIKPFNTEL